jgi:copper chaperone CopZ
METKIEVSYTLQQFGDAVKINLLTLEGDMDLSFDPKKVSIEQIYDALKEMGYPAFGSPRYLN